MALAARPVAEGARSPKLTQGDATTAAKEILGRRGGEPEIRVIVDNPNDCKQTITAFRSLGCKVKVEKDGALLRVTPPAKN